MKGDDNMAALKIEYIKARSYSYGGSRSLSSIKFIVIHYTGNDGDTYKGNLNYFANSNTRSAGAHFFVSQDGGIGQSIDMSLTAWAVGGSKYSDCARTGGGKYYGICTNANSVSIELCDNASKDPSAAQIKATKELVAYIRSKCPNANTIIRHFDVSGKSCPERLIDSKKWSNFVKKISGGTNSGVVVSGGGSSSSNGNKNIKTGQEWSNKFTGKTITCDGVRGPATRKQSVKVLQTALNKQYKAGLEVDGVLGPKTKAALGSHSIKKGDKSYLVQGAKVMLKMLGKAGMKYDRGFGSGCSKAAGKDKITASDLISYTK